MVLHSKKPLIYRTLHLMCGRKLEKFMILYWLLMFWEIWTCVYFFYFKNLVRNNVLFLQKWAVSTLKVVYTLVQNSFLEKSMMAPTVMIYSVILLSYIAQSTCQLSSPATSMSSGQTWYMWLNWSYMSYWLA